MDQKHLEEIQKLEYDRGFFAGYNKAKNEIIEELIKDVDKLLKEYKEQVK